MSETILVEHNSNQPLITTTTTNDIDRNSEDKHLLSNQDNSISSSNTSILSVHLSQ